MLLRSRPAATSPLLALFVAYALTLTPMTAGADSAHEAAAEELLRLIRIDRNLAPMAVRMRLSTVQQIRAQEVPEAEESLVAPYLNRIGDLIEHTLSWEQLREDFVAIYTSTFSHDELQTLIEFFRSPAGGKYLANVGHLNRQATEVVRHHAMATAPEVQAITEEMLRAVEAH